MMYSSSSTSSSSSTTSSTTMTKYANRHVHHSTALQSLVRTKCWSIAPLWKFVTYELEHQGPTTASGLYRSASVRTKKSRSSKSRSSDPDVENPKMLRGIEAKTSITGGRRVPILSKPHPHQSFKLASNQQPRQPLQQANRMQGSDVVVGLPPKIPKPSVSPSSVSSQIETISSNEDSEWKPCGVLKKPGSYRGHASLKKVAFLENTELNRSTL